MSSATSTTAPPVTPVYAAVKNGSAATFSPTCFMHDSERTPPMDAPIATSTPTFSLGAHSTWISSNFAAVSVTSVLGVPGYDDITFTPASQAPLAKASLPSMIFFAMIFPSPSSEFYITFYHTIRHLHTAGSWYPLLFRSAEYFFVLLHLADFHP